MNQRERISRAIDELVDAICPEVAEPEQPEPYDYGADWTTELGPSGDKYLRWNCNYCGLSRYREPTARHNCPEQPTPAEPIDEAVYKAASKIPGMGMGPARRQQIKVAVLKDRELRSKACGGSSERSSSVSSSGSSSTKPPTTTDLRRLTEDEVLQAWDSGETVELGLRAVADAQLERARVTISEAEIWNTTNGTWADAGVAERFAELLRSKGVEVVRDRRRQ